MEVDANPGGFDRALGVAALSDGAFAVTGQADVPGGLDYVSDIVVGVIGQTGSVEWVNLVDGAGQAENGGGSTDFGYGVATLTDGNFVVVGNEFVDDLGIVTMASEYPWIRRYSAAGRAAWTKQAPSFPAGRAYAVAVGPQQNIYVGGSESQTGKSWLRAYNENGAEVWALPGAPSGWIAKIIVDGDGRLVTTTTLTGGLDYDVGLTVLDASGAELWSKVLDFGAYERPLGAGVDPMGNITFLGNGVTYFLERYDPSGALLWHLDDPLGSGPSINSMAVAPDGGFVLVGNTYSPATGSDMFIRRYDSEAGLLWEQVWSGVGQTNDSANATAFTADGRVVVAGVADGPAMDMNANTWVGLLSP